MFDEILHSIEGVVGIQFMPQLDLINICRHRLIWIRHFGRIHVVEIDWSYRNEYEVRLKRERLIDAT